MGHLGRSGGRWEQLSGYFPVALSACRKAALHQLGQQVGVPTAGSLLAQGEKVAWGTRGLHVPVHSGNSWREVEERQADAGVESGEGKWGGGGGVQGAAA